MGHACSGSKHCTACDGPYEPKRGDRVRVTSFEGEVNYVAPSGRYQVIVGADRGMDFSHYWGRPGDQGVTIEKLADPEPVWVNRDVILVRNDKGVATPMIYTANSSGDAFWACAHCLTGAHSRGAVSEDWAAGSVEILWKADANEEPTS